MRGGVAKRCNRFDIVSVSDPKTGGRHEVWQGVFATLQDAVDARREQLPSAAVSGSPNQ